MTDARQPPLTSDLPARSRSRRRRDIASGWCISAAVHLAVGMLLLATRQFFVGSGGGGGGGQGGAGGSVAGAFLSTSGSAASPYAATEEEGDTQSTVAATSHVNIQVEPFPRTLTVRSPRRVTPTVSQTAFESPVTGDRAARSVANASHSSAADNGTANDGTGAGSGRLAAGGPGSGGAGSGGTSLFGIADRGRRFVFVIDRSSSMLDDDKFAAAKRELARSLAQLDDACEFQVIFFNQTPLLLETRAARSSLFRGIESHRRLALSQAQFVTAEGATRPLAALEAALALQPDVLFFLTDGEEPRLSAADLARVARMNRGGARIHCVRFVSGDDGDADGDAVLDHSNWLRALSAASHGEYAVRDVSRRAAPARAP